MSGKSIIMLLMVGFQRDLVVVLLPALVRTYRLLAVLHINITFFICHLSHDVDDAALKAAVEEAGYEFVE